MSDYIETSVLIANLNKSSNCPITNREREDEIEYFFESLFTEPDFVLLQDAYVGKHSRIDQIRTVQNALSDNWKFQKKMEYETNIYQKFTAILNDSSQMEFANTKAFFGNAFFLRLNTRNS